MVEWLAGNRIRGTSTERTSTTGFNPVVGGWKELGRHKLVSASNDWGVSGLDNKRYLMLLYNETGHNGANGNGCIKYNADGGTSYSSRLSNNGTGDWAPINGTFGRFMNDTGIGEPQFAVGYVGNLSTKEKLGMIHSVQQNAIGATNAPEREESVHKWTGSDPIDQINIYDNGLNNSATGSELVVLGWDPADTHTDNFWEELASVELGVAGDNLSSGTITAKKYLWVQAWIKSSTSAVTANVTFNNDTVSSNYNLRYNTNGTGDNITGATTNLNVGIGGDNTTGMFHNMFIINNSANEKLMMNHAVAAETAGAGYAPSRGETVGKWANTSAQITEIDFTNSTASRDYAIGSIIKVYGSN
jgi:hypothetical protein